MKIKDAIIDAVKRGDSGRVGRIADIMRFKYGYDYENTFDNFHRLTGIKRSVFDAMLYESEVTA